MCFVRYPYTYVTVHMFFMTNVVIYSDVEESTISEKVFIFSY